ncbi:unnamed protein product [Effrenium voratum]|nr:unnamed protein product [Effrenium voratum]
MKKLVAEAQEVGERANAARTSVQAIQKKIEKARLGRAMGSGPHDPSSKEMPPLPDTQEVAGLSREMEEKIATYKSSMERLKVVKAEIDRYRAAAQENKERLQRDFEAWYLSLQAHQAGDPGGQAQVQVPAATLPAAEPRPASATSPRREEVEPNPRSNSASAPRQGIRGRDMAPSPQSSPERQAAPPEALTGRQAAPSPHMPSSAAAAPTEALTGHQQTDDDIRAYFAAVANLESR